MENSSYMYLVIIPLRVLWLVHMRDARGRTVPEDIPKYTNEDIIAN